MKTYDQLSTEEKTELQKAAMIGELATSLANTAKSIGVNPADLIHIILALANQKMAL